MLGKNCTGDLLEETFTKSRQSDGETFVKSIKNVPNRSIDRATMKFLQSLSASVMER